MTKLLIIEDDEQLRACYRSILGPAGYETIFSLDITEISLIMHGVDLVMSDYNMGLDFNELAQMAAELKKPFLAVTSVTEKIHDNQLCKPFGKKELLYRLSLLEQGTKLCA